MRPSLALKVPGYRATLAARFFDEAPEELWELMEFAETIGETPEKFADGFSASFWATTGPTGPGLAQQLAALRLAFAAGKRRP